MCFFGGAADDRLPPAISPVTRVSARFLSWPPRRARLGLRWMLWSPERRRLPDDARSFAEMIAAAPYRVHVLGPVHGAAKARFFAMIDVFVFPTRYAHEADPLVVWEALAAGRPVIAYARGCIREQVGDAGLLIEVHQSFVPFPHSKRFAHCLMIRSR